MTLSTPAAFIFSFKAARLLLFMASPRIVTSQAHLEFLLRKKSLLTPVSCSYAANSKCLQLTVNQCQLVKDQKRSGSLEKKTKYHTPCTLN